MLGDDIMEGTKRGVRIVGHAVKNVFKGALLFAAVVGGAYAVGTIGLALASGTGLAAVGASIAEGAGMLLSGSMPAGVSNTLGYAAIAGGIGGLVTGVASLLPGSDEGFSLGKLFKRKDRSRQREQSQQMAPAQHGSRSHHTETHYRDVEYRTVQAPSPAPAAGAPTYIVHTPSTIVDNSQRTQVYHSEAPRNVAYKSGNTRNEEQNTLNYSPETSTAVNIPVEVKAAQPANQAPMLNAKETAPATGDNPLYRPGKGVELMQRGDAAQPTMSK